MITISGVEFHRLRMPLKSPFETSFGRMDHREVLLLRIDGADARSGVATFGWSECIALTTPVYSTEYLDGADDVIRRFVLPLVVEEMRAHGGITAERFAHATRAVVGHRMAKAAVESAIIDAELRARSTPLAEYLGATEFRVPAGVSIGIAADLPALLSTVEGFLAEGYRRIKLKIKPGWDLEPVRAVRREFGDIRLQVDANTAYQLSDAPHLRRLDEFGLLLIEQPLAEDDLRQHAELASRIDTPICLDESVTSSAVAADAIALGAAQIINIKPARVGGLLEARRIHDLALANGVAVWCGGMLETGVGRAANIALAALPGFTLPGDVSASDRFYAQDLTPPFVLDDGYVRVPTGPGIGVEPLPELIAQFTTRSDRVSLA